jgi:autotransporter-associated beta strand protein
VNISGNNTIGGTVTLSSGGGNYWIRSDAGTVNLANITAAATGTRTITLQGAGDGGVNGAITDGAASVAIVKDGTGTWTLAGNADYSGVTTVNGGTLRLATSLVRSAALTINSGAVVQLASNGTNGRVLKTTNLGIAPAGRLDLTDNKLITNTPVGTSASGTYDGVQGEVQRAYNFGSWDAPGLLTSDPRAAAAIGLTTIGVASAEQILFVAPTETATWAGQTVSGASTLAMYTYAGDLNFDGLVDAQDYGLIDNFVQFPGTDGYANGDINYDGIIDAGDYGIIDNTIQLQGAPISLAGDIASTNETGITPVPEPGSVTAFALATTTMLARRVRRRRHAAGRPPALGEPPVIHAGHRWPNRRLNSPLSRPSTSPSPSKSKYHR